MLIIDIVGFAHVVFKVVEFVDGFVVFADVQFPLSTSNRFNGVAFVIKEVVVLGLGIGLVEHKGADIFAVDDAIGGDGCATGLSQGG